MTYLTRLAALILISLGVLASVAPARGDDAGTWGGLYRSRDAGVTWFPLDAGLFVGTALAIASHPADPNQLLYGIDSRLLRSANGGRDWSHLAPTFVYGPIFAIAFRADGKRAFASNGSAIFFSDDLSTWREARFSPGAAPVLAFAQVGARLLGASADGLLQSQDGGESWSMSATGLPDAPVTALVVGSGESAPLYALCEGALWLSVDGGTRWTRHPAPSPLRALQTIAMDILRPDVLWGGASNQVFTLKTGDKTWQPVGSALPDKKLTIRGIAAAGNTITLTTSSGLYRSIDTGQTWALTVGNLPNHLEAGPLLAADQGNTLYAGFSLRPYDELWRFALQVAAQTRSKHATLRLTMMVVFAVLAIALVVLYFLRRRRRTSAATTPAIPETNAL